MSLSIHYAIQTCDISSYQGQKRFASDDRTEISKKSIKSLLQSVRYCSEKHPDSFHHVAIIDDQCSENLKAFIQKCILDFSSESIKIDVIQHEKQLGIRKSIEYCYRWLQENGKDFVYQIQDDYLFDEKAIYEIHDVYQQMKIETGSEAIISPYNDVHNWLTAYRNIPTPRTVIVSKFRYWIQYYDMTCSFFTSHKQFSEHWELYNYFLYLVDKKNGKELENTSLNYILTKRSVLGLIPVNSLAFHLQSELEKDPHIDYRPLWDSIDIT